MKEEKKHFLEYQGPVMFWALVIFVLSSIPGSCYPSVNFVGADKVVHFFLYFFLGGLSYIALRFQDRKMFLRVYAGWLSLVICVLYGASDELHQLLTPGRSCELLDWAADCLGASIGLLVTIGLVLWYEARTSAGETY